MFEIGYQIGEWIGTGVQDVCNAIFGGVNTIIAILSVPLRMLFEGVTMALSAISVTFAFSGAGIMPEIIVAGSMCFLLVAVIRIFL